LNRSVRQHRAGRSRSISQHDFLLVERQKKAPAGAGASCER
jgi:hypothetical protein